MDNITMIKTKDNKIWVTSDIDKIGIEVPIENSSKDFLDGTDYDKDSVSFSYALRKFLYGNKQKEDL